GRTGASSTAGCAASWGCSCGILVTRRGCRRPFEPRAPRRDVRPPGAERKGPFLDRRSAARSNLAARRCAWHYHSATSLVVRRTALQPSGGFHVRTLARTAAPCPKVAARLRHRVARLHDHRERRRRAHVPGHGGRDPAPGPELSRLGASGTDRVRPP